MRSTHLISGAAAVFASLSLLLAPCAAIAEDLTEMECEVAATAEPITFANETGGETTMNDYQVIKQGANKTFDEGWYYLPESVRFNERVEIEGDVNIVFDDNATMECVWGVHLAEGNTLTIWSTGGNHAHGWLKVAHADKNNAGVGGNNGEKAGTFVVASGMAVVAGSFDDAAAIGGGRGADGGLVEVHNGSLQALNDEGFGAAIGGGANANGGELHVFERGSVNASAARGRAAGIGGGDHGNGGVVTIDGGYVTAEGGREAAAIGGGRAMNPYGELAGGAGGPVSVAEGSRLRLTSYDGGAAIGAGKGCEEQGELTYYERACVAKDEVLVDAHDRDATLRSSDGLVELSACEHGEEAFEMTETEHVRGCKFCGEPYGSGAHEFGEGDTCEICGYQKQAQEQDEQKQDEQPQDEQPQDGQEKKTAPKADYAAAQVFGHTLTLDGTIGVNTYLVFDEFWTKPARARDVYVEFYDENNNLYAICPMIEHENPLRNAKRVKTMEQKEVKLADGTSVTAYVATFTVPAKDMGKKLTMKIRSSGTGYFGFANSDGSYIRAKKGISYSVMDYLDDRIEHSNNPKMVTLARDMKNYGIYAKHYFDMREGVAGELPTVDGFKKISAQDLGTAYSKPKNIKHFTYLGTTLNLIDRTDYRMNFESDDPDALKIEFSHDGKTEQLKPRQAEDGRYYVAIEGIAAQDLDEMYDITITNGSETTTAFHGPYGYAQWALTQADKARNEGKEPNEALEALVMAMYHYNVSSQTYLND